MLQFLLPMLISMGASGIGSGLAAGTASSANRRDAEIMKARRAMLERERGRIREGGAGFGAALDEQANRDFSRAADQIGAQAASTGMTNAGRGGQDAMQAEVLGGILASLAQAKQQDELERQRMILELMNDPAYASADPSAFNPGQDALMGILGGLASGAGNTMAAFTGTEPGMEMLMSLFGGGDGDGGPTQALTPLQMAFGSGGAHQFGGFPSNQPALGGMTGRERNVRQQYAGLPPARPNITYNPMMGNRPRGYTRQ